MSKPEVLLIYPLMIDGMTSLAGVSCISAIHPTETNVIDVLDECNKEYKTYMKVHLFVNKAGIISCNKSIEQCVTEGDCSYVVFWIPDYPRNLRVELQTGKWVPYSEALCLCRGKASKASPPGKASQVEGLTGKDTDLMSRIGIGSYSLFDEVRTKKALDLIDATEVVLGSLREKFMKHLDKIC